MADKFFSRTVEQMEVLFDKISEGYSKFAIDSMLAAKLDKAVGKRIVDDGPKNRIILGFPTTTKNTVAATPNADGSITINGTNSSSSNAVLVFDLWGNASASSDNKQNPFTQNGVYIMKGSGSDDVRIQFYGYNDDLQLTQLANSASDVEVTIDGTYQYYVFRLWMKGSAAFDNLKLYPMCCLKDLYQISSEFRPYVPTNGELYEMIKALQPATLMSMQSPVTLTDSLTDSPQEDV